MPSKKRFIKKPSKLKANGIKEAIEAFTVPHIQGRMGNVIINPKK